ncbi:hypothetical protein ACFX2I_000226 [Malus domestica]
MELSSKLHRLDLRSTFLSGSAPFDAPATALTSRLRSLSNPIASQSLRANNNTNSIKTTSHLHKPTTPIPKFATPLLAVAVETSVAETTDKDDFESLFSDNSNNEFQNRRGKKNSNDSGASSISSGVKLENVRKRIIAGLEEPR